MNVVLDHGSVLQGYTGPGTTWTNEVNFGMKHAPRAGSFAVPVALHCTKIQVGGVGVKYGEGGGGAGEWRTENRDTAYKPTE